MSGRRLFCVLLLPALAACGGRTPLGHLRSKDVGNAGGTDAVGNGGGGSPVGAGGAVGLGGALPSGGTLAVGGTAGTHRTGGTVVGAGGRPSSGGTQGFGGLTTGGSPRGGGGAGAAGGRSRTGGQIRTGGRSGTGGSGGTIAVGGSMETGGTVGTGGTAGTGGTVSLGGGIGSGGMTSSGGSTTGGAPGLGGATGIPSTCGDGIIDPGEQCDLGADNQDAPAFLVTQAGRSFAATPLVRDVTCSELYDYRSASSHTGLEELGTSRIMLHMYEPDFGLSLIFFHGVDEDSTGLEQPESGVQMKFSGLPETATVAVVDDEISDELWMESAPGTATGWWNFRNNTDGGAFSGLPFPGDWQIELEPSFAKGITIWTWVQSDIGLIDLDPAQSLSIKAYSSPSACRTNCTIPACGDGILDGGEICDPGVPTGYYCSDDCRSFD